MALQRKETNMLQRIFNNGLCIPIPFLSRWLPGLCVRLVRWDLNPSDAEDVAAGKWRVGVTFQLEGTRR